LQALLDAREKLATLLGTMDSAAATEERLKAALGDPRSPTKAHAASLTVVNEDVFGAIEDMIARIDDRLVDAGATPRDTARGSPVRHVPGKVQ
jgi:hypothetical protein